MGRFARGVDEASVEPSLVLRGSEPEIVPGRNGRLLDRAAAETVFIQALTALSRKPVAVPLKVDRTQLATQDLVGAKVKAETALSAPVDVAYGPGSWHLTVAKITRLLELPSNGDTELRLAGPRADHFFSNLKKRVDHAPKDATFAVGARNIVRVVPAQPGRTLDMQATTRNLMAALLSPTTRKADLAVTTAAPERTTPDARAMGITGLVGAYETFYGGVPNRIHNVQLVAHLIDNHFIAPNEEFSFNGTTGEPLRVQGLPRGARDHQRRAQDRPRRRRLPGLDDDVQRRLRGRPADHRPDEPRALHQPLPAGPRRDGQLSGHRPQVRQRHGPLALAADVRQLVIADRRALRDAAAPAGAERGLAARRHRRSRP